MRWLEGIARWLAPDLGQRADRYDYLMSTIETCSQELHEFPDAADTLIFLEETDHNRWRTPLAPLACIMPADIEEFREMLRREARAATSRRGWPCEAPPRQCAARSA